MNRVVSAAAAAIAVGATLFFGSPAQADTPGSDMVEQVGAVLQQIHDIVEQLPDDAVTSSSGRQVSTGVKADPQEVADALNAAFQVSHLSGSAAQKVVDAVRETPKRLRGVPAADRADIGVQEVTSAADAVTPAVARLGVSQVEPALRAVADKATTDVPRVLQRISLD